ncbi:TonB-dependent siderophore receptor [Phenylobacterium sp.]|uniref:TonB-dependent receptor n=1 Tax=Phenylobacterium sp. TaxID=1871053 RepID=UPI0028A2B31A|nr:TonB-dependent siderophore receptor [Phenylobacterium sp.]
MDKTASDVNGGWKLVTGHGGTAFLACVGFFAAASPALAEAEANTVSGVTIVGRAEDSDKRTAPLLDTPQTISVIPHQVIEEQGARTLTEVLRNTPGISFNAGENGFSTSTNNFSMRGFDASGSVFVDGARDSGSYSRDMFNVDRVEVVKGPSADNGRGNAGGYVNIITKSPLTENAISGSVSYGFDEYDSDDRRRATLDLNQVVSEGLAVRINAMVEDSGVAGRELAQKQSWGVAPSLAISLTPDLRVLLSYEHLNQDDRPDWGVPGAAIKDTAAYNPATSGWSRDSFFGLRSDFDETRSDAFLVRVEGKIGENIRVSNQTRFAQVERNARFTVPTSFNAGSGAVATQTQFYDRENESFGNFTNLSARFGSDALAHSISAGLEITRETSRADRRGTSNPPATSLLSPNPDRAPGANLPVTEVASVTIDTIAAYLYDTVSFGEHWEVTGGVRVENYDAAISSRTAAGALAGLGGFDLSDTTWAGKLGVVYKPVANGSVYASIGTAAQPPGSYLSNPDISRTGDNAFPGFVAGADTVRLDNYEVGVKWALLEGRLSTTAALFRTVKRDVPITGRDVGDTADSLKGYGEQIVQGLEVGVAGKITEAWTVFAGAAWMESERKHSAYLDEVRRRANPADYGTVLRTDGDRLAFTPDFTANLWTTYSLPFGLTLGGGLQHVGSSYLGRPDDANRIIPNGAFGKLPSYTIISAYAAYDVTDKVELRLNIDNLTDETYAVSTNWNGSRATLGAPRTVLLTAALQF